MLNLYLKISEKYKRMFVVIFRLNFEESIVLFEQFTGKNYFRDKIKGG